MLLLYRSAWIIQWHLIIKHLTYISYITYADSAIRHKITVARFLDDNLRYHYSSIENLFQRATIALNLVPYIFHYLYHIICAAEHYTFYKEK